VADEPIYIGGQAVIEGVMMRGEAVWAVAVRTPDGAIDVSVRDLPAWGTRFRAVPLVRGVVAVGESIVLGLRALTHAAGRAAGEVEGLSAGQTAATLGLAVALFTSIFIVLPALVANQLFDGTLAFNLVEGLLRLALFIGYLVAIGRVAGIRRLFEYHGAEHKAIAAYENGVELTPARAQRFNTEHVRCGTNLLLTVMVTSIVVFSVLGRPSVPLLVASRALLLPAVAAIAYEVIRLAARHMDRPVARGLMRAGLALQRLTTREPSLAQLEVAIAALRAALSAGRRAEVAPRDLVGGGRS
jgi:uncharacterized protein YqhQ